MAACMFVFEMVSCRVGGPVVGDWQQHPTPEVFLTRVSYEDSVVDLSTSAYADDLLRVKAADTAGGIEADTVQHLCELQTDLQSLRFHLNLRKSESLVSIRGRGSYVAARSLFSWSLERAATQTLCQIPWRASSTF